LPKEDIMIILRGMLYNRLIILNLLIFISFTAGASELDTDRSYPRIGLALSGGGIRGIAHIGVIRRLEEEGIKLHMISGSSMGALIGSFYALGYDSYEIENMIKESETKEVFSNKPDRHYTENYLKKTSDRTVVELELTKKGIQLPNALNNGHKVLKKLRKFILASEYYDENFDSLKYKLRVVCSDIQSAGKVVFKEGDLPLIIMGSMSFPGLFKPVIYKDMRLLDGGLTDNIPTGVLDNCDFILASDTTHDTPAGDKEYNFIELLDRISVMMTGTNTDKSLEAANIVFRPDLENISITEIENPDSLIKAGYIEADRKIEEIKSLINFSRYKIPGQSDFNLIDTEITGNRIYTEEEIITELSSITSYRDAVRAIKKKYKNGGYILADASFIHGTEKDTLKISEGVINKIDIKGDHSTKKSFIRDELAFSKGKVLRFSDIENSVDNLYGTGLFSRVSYSLDQEEKKVTIVVEEQPYHLIRLGANYQTDRGFLGLIELANKNLHGKRAEIYGGLTYGEKLNRVEFSYYNPFMIKSAIFFELMPYYQVKDREFFVDHNRQDELTSKEERVGSNFNLGFQFLDNYQGTFSIVQEYIDFMNEYYNRTSLILRVLVDSRNDPLIPSRGVYFSWNIETGLSGKKIFDFGNEYKYQKIWYELSVYKKLFGRLYLETGFCGGSGDKLVPVTEKFFLGGIKMMPGIFYEEYSVNQYLRFKFRQNILIHEATLFDIYLTSGYYLNGMWEERLDKIEWDDKYFLNSFYLGMTMQTAIGPLEAGWGLSAGNGVIKNNNRLFLSFGYILQ
jgi:predicted acylesterase/phospholipase RssA